jgi:hypothetical protein
LLVWSISGEVVANVAQRSGHCARSIRERERERELSTLLWSSL